MTTTKTSSSLFLHDLGCKNSPFAFFVCVHPRVSVAKNASSFFLFPPIRKIGGSDCFFLFFRNYLAPCATALSLVHKSISVSFVPRFADSFHPCSHSCRENTKRCVIASHASRFSKHHADLAFHKPQNLLLSTRLHSPFRTGPAASFAFRPFTVKKEMRHNASLASHT
jgi:hypothetical protein